MSLGNLTFVADIASAKDLTERARQNFLIRVTEQIEVAEAHLRGETLMKKVMQTVTDPDTGESKRVEVTKQHRLWWRRGENGFVVFPRVGFKRLELVEGKPAIAAKYKKDVVKILKTLKQAAEKGELDEVLTKAAERKKRKAA